MGWRWLLGGAAAILVGFAVWATTFVLVPTGVVLIIVGLVKLVRAHRRPTTAPPSPS